MSTQPETPPERTGDIYQDVVSVSIRDEEAPQLDLQEMKAQIRSLEGLAKKAKARVRYYKRVLEREVSISEETEALIQTGLDVFNLETEYSEDA